MTTHHHTLRRLRGFVLALALPAAVGFAQTDQSPSAAPTTATGSATVPVTETNSPPVQLEAVTVLGSHIPSADVQGISPVTIINQDYIQASGFLNTSDLLNNLAQVYSGAGAGPGSVPNMNNPASGTTSFAFNFSTYAPDFGQSGVSGVSLGGLGSSDTLVLIDGRRAPNFPIGNESNPTNASFVNVNTIPLSMIDHIEVLPGGASAIYGADAVAGVINIVLKKNFTGSELSATFKTSQHGGGSEYDTTLTTGFTRGKLSALVMFDYKEDFGLKASQRSFSDSADHTAQGGTDLRLPYGFPAVVESVASGFGGAPPLNGVTDANGNPVTVAFVPAGQNGTNLKPSQFIGLTYPSTGGYYPYTYDPRPFDQAPYLSLIPPSENWGTRVHVDYNVSDNLKIYVEATFNRASSDEMSVPPSFAPGGGFSFAPSIIVPASDPDNPFGQNVTVALTDANFGPTRQMLRTDAYSYRAGAQGKMGDTWNWDASVGYDVQESHQAQTSLDVNLIDASFNNANASQRYNPFVGEYSASNAALYPSLTDLDTEVGFASTTSALLNINGQPFNLPGGKLGVAAGAEFYHLLDQSSTNYVYQGAATTDLPYDQLPYTSNELNTYGFYGELAVPIFGKPNRKPLLERLELQLGGRYDGSGQYRKATPQLGLVWEPVKAILIRGTYSQGFTAPSLTQYDQAVVINPPGNNEVIDPARGGETNANYTEEAGSDPNIQPETSDNYGLGVVFTPPFIKGLSFGADWNLTKQNNIIQNLGDQSIVDNEAAFPGRVVRGPVPAGDPYGVGLITFIDNRTANFGSTSASSINYHISYDLPWRELGKFTLTASAVRTLTFEYNLEPGVPYQNVVGDTEAPPVWKGLASVQWTKGDWTAMLFAYYTGPFGTNESNNALDYEPGFLIVHEASFTTFDLNVGYRFRRGVWHGYGKDVRVAVGMQNIGDIHPPFSNSIFGYDGNYSPLGRTFSVQLNVPF